MDALTRPAYEPKVCDLAPQLPEIGSGIAEALEALARQPSPARARQAATLIDGAQFYVRRLQVALLREADGQPNGE